MWGRVEKNNFFEGGGPAASLDVASCAPTFVLPDFREAQMSWLIFFFLDPTPKSGILTLLANPPHLVPSYVVGTLIRTYDGAEG